MRLAIGRVDPAKVSRLIRRDDPVHDEDEGARHPDRQRSAVPPYRQTR